MKANELMIGDWAAFQGHPYQMTANDIVSIADCEARGVPTDLSEIPITAEILAKNGFIRENLSIDYFTEYDDFYDLAIYEETDSIWCFEYKNCEAIFPLYRVLISHIHELQHVLRLCGIEKEIEL